MAVKDILLEAGFTISSESNGFYRMKPLHRISTNNTSLSVSKTTGYFTDFVTGEKGSLKHLIKISTGRDVEFSSESSVELDSLKNEMPFNPAGCVEKLFPSYGFYIKKGISKETLETFGCGYCQGGKMYKRFVFPILNPDGSLVGYAGRAIVDHPRKWKNIGSTRKWLYPLKWSEEYIRKSREVILVESIGNMLALWECGYRNVIVCFGTGLSKAVLSELIRLNPSRIILAMDNDDNEMNPGQKAANSHEKELIKWFDKSKICRKLPPSGVDLSSLFEKQGKTAIDDWYKN